MEREMIQCSCCGVELPATEEYFHRAGKGKGGGLRRDCKQCRKMKRLENIQHIREKEREWRARNRDHIRERRRRYYQEHREEIKEYNREYYKKKRGNGRDDGN